jgi:hypothetical protein
MRGYKAAAFAMDVDRYESIKAAPSEVLFKSYGPKCPLRGHLKNPIMGAAHIQKA